MTRELQREQTSLSWTDPLPGPAIVTAWSPLAEQDHRFVCMKSRIAGAVPPHMHARHHLGVVEQGTATLRSEGRQWQVRAGDVIWHVPRQIHAISSDHCRCRWIAVDEDSMSQLMLAGGTRGPEETRVFADSALAAGFLEVHRGFERGAVTRSAADTLSSLISALSAMCVDKAVPPSLPTSAVERCRLEIRNGYVGTLQLVDLARTVGMSLFHLARMFAAALNVPPHTYMLHLRVAWAQTLLRRGFSGSRAAYETGFADQSHCIRVHRRLLGLSPFGALALEKQLPLRADDFAHLAGSAIHGAALLLQP